MAWNVIISAKAQKQLAKLPKSVQDSVYLLLRHIQNTGPVQGAWPNYGKLSYTSHHCHIKKGHPCYVAVWEVVDAKVQLVEVKYVGTHERAPY